MERFELRNHPAQARDPLTGRPLVDKHGKPVPLFPELRSIYFDGFLMGYCGFEPGSHVTLIRPYPDTIVEEVREFVSQQIGEPAGVGQPPLPLEVDPDGEPADDTDDDVEDE